MSNTLDLTKPLCLRGDADKPESERREVRYLATMPDGDLAMAILADGSWRLERCSCDGTNKWGCDKHDIINVPPKPRTREAIVVWHRNRDGQDVNAFRTKLEADKYMNRFGEEILATAEVTLIEGQFAKAAESAGVE